MLNTLLSGDLPRSRVLAVLLAIIVACLALGPFLFDGTRAFAMLGMICIFIIVVASYDLMLGYTHIVSFAHTMFFGIGAYGVAMAITAYGNSFGAIFIGLGCAILLTIVLSLLLGLLSLRVKAIFFALVTLAVAFAFLSLVNQLYTMTGGEDGLRVQVPRELGPAFRLTDATLYGFSIAGFLGGLFSGAGGIAELARESVFTVRVTGRVLTYYVAFGVAVLVFLGLLRLVNSPFGRVLQAIRENEFRAEAIGYRVVVYRTTAAVLSALFATLAGAMLAIWLRPRAERLGSAGPATALALVLTAMWSLAEGIELKGSLVVTVLETARNLSWLLVIYRLFADDGRHDSLAPIRPMLGALIFVELLLLGLDISLAQLPADADINDVSLGLDIMLRLLVTVGALVLVHNLYGGASPDARLGLRWPAAGLAVIWVFDLNLYTVAYLSGGWPREIAALRGLATIALVGLFALGATHGREALRLKPSRAMTFQTFSLLLIGIYLVGMVLVAQWLAYMGGDFARLIELGFLTIASAVALLVLPSRKLRGWLKVVVSKHLFQHRYDYREEWLRFTRTIGNTGPEAPSLEERAIQALADVTGSSAGLLLTADEGGGVALAARWNWSSIGGAMAIDGDYARFLESKTFIAELDEIRHARHVRPGEARAPAWLLDDPRAWALVPLIHYERLVAVVVLARPEVRRKLDWEDFDLLRVVGQQLASYLAEDASHEALAEANRFDDFNRRIAFVMHDIKNLASQFSLLARNAELHAEKKAFRDDMLVTLRNSSEKLNALIARLSRYGSGGGDKLEHVAAHDVARAVVARFAPASPVLLAECQPLRVMANRHSLEQVLVHLVQNGIDASFSGSPVLLSLVADGGSAQFEVADTGSGMSPEFVRTRLFKPFVSTKSGGFGIGAFEARELVQAMRGTLDVDSREGLGSRFIVRIPLAQAGAAADADISIEQRVA